MSTVDDVKARLDIVDVVSGYVNLIKAGRNYKALCPFHQERTPSFILFPDTQTWRCFGACGEGGDIFGFVMRAEGWDFSEALRELAKRAGVEVASYTPETTEQQAQSDRLRDLLEKAVRFFHDQLLKAPTGQVARDYLERRYLNEQTIESFALGYAPNDWRQAMHYLQLQGYNQDEIVEAGIAIHSEEKKSVYDRFRHRLMIPIRDGRGRTVGFGARALNKEDNPKYLNSPQGPLFDKSRLLFGLDMARRSIRETETVVVVEGYMDVMQAHQAGFTNVVAQMGTALTEPQLRQLDKYANRLILALDPDAAGVHATMRGLNVAQQTLHDEKRVSFDPHGMMRYTGILELDLRVVSLPGEQDPDELIHDNPEAWEQLIASAVPVADYVIQQGTAHLDSHASIQERESVARELLPILTATESDLQRNGNIQALARRVRIDERILIQWSRQRQVAETRTQLKLKDQRKLAGRAALPAISSPPGQSTPREGFCLAMLIQQPDWFYAANRKLRQLQGQDEILAEVLGPLGPEDFTRPDHREIFQGLVQALYQEDFEPLEYLYRHLPSELMQTIEQLQKPEMENFQQNLSGPLTAELQSILRDQARINALPEPSTSLFVQEALTLRLTRLERESHEYYFLQQDAQALDSSLTDDYYHSTMEAIVKARQLIALALQQMKSLSRDV